MQDRWNYIARDERNPSRPAIWYLQDSDPPLKVVRLCFFKSSKPAEYEIFPLGIKKRTTLITMDWMPTLATPGEAGERLVPGPPSL